MHVTQSECLRGVNVPTTDGHSLCAQHPTDCGDLVFDTAKTVCSEAALEHRSIAHNQVYLAISGCQYRHLWSGCSRQGGFRSRRLCEVGSILGTDLGICVSVEIRLEFG
jgi:hypothetical protein